MSQPQQSEPQPQDDEIDLVELFRALWQGKWWISGTTVIAAVVAVLYALSLPDQYSSDALLSPVQDEGGGRLTSMAQQYGGLASMAGIDLGSGQAGKREIAIETLRSRQFLMDFIERHNLRAPLLATKGWDPQREQWLYDTERYDPQTGEWQAPEDDPNDPEPSLWQAYQALEAMVSISDDPESGMVTLSVESESPLAARDWVQWMIEDINEYMKNRDMQETRRNVDYLETQLEETSISGMRQVFFSLIEEQTQTLMLAELDDEYAFQIIDPPLIPEERSAPSRSLIAVLGVLLGGMLSTFGVLVRYAFSNRNRSE